MGPNEKFLLRAASMVRTAQTVRQVSRPSLRPFLFHSFHSTPRTFAEGSKTALVLGSSGTVGSTLSRHLSQDHQMTVIGADVLELPNLSDWELDGFVPLPHFSTHPSLEELTQRLVTGVGYCLEGGGGGDGKIDAIVCAAGGWEGDPPGPAGDSEDEVAEAAGKYGATVDRMLRMNLYPVVASGFVASQYMADEGIFVVMGAAAALEPTPGMVGYGMSKASAHHFVHTLGATTGLAVSLQKSKKKQAKKIRQQAEYLDTLTVVGILPTMIDTPSNRDANPKADYDQWTKPIDIAKEIGKWIERPHLRPHSGSLVKVLPTSAGATFRLVR